MLNTEQLLTATTYRQTPCEALRQMLADARTELTGIEESADRQREYMRGLQTAIYGHELGVHVGEWIDYRFARAIVGPFQVQWISGSYISAQAADGRMLHGEFERFKKVDAPHA